MSTRAPGMVSSSSAAYMAAGPGADDRHPQRLAAAHDERRRAPAPAAAAPARARVVGGVDAGEGLLGVVSCVCGLIASTGQA